MRFAEPLASADVDLDSMLSQSPISCLVELTLLVLSGSLFVACSSAGENSESDTSAGSTTTQLTSDGSVSGSTTGEASPSSVTSGSSSDGLPGATSGGLDTTVSGAGGTGATTSAGGALSDTTSGGVTDGGGSGVDSTTSVGGQSSGSDTTSGGNGGAGDTTTGDTTTGDTTTGDTTTGDTTTGGTTTAGTTTGGGGTGGNASGCPTHLEGFATLNTMGQDGTYGGRDGETVTVTTHAELDQYATASEPYTIRVQGAITISPKGTEIRVASDKTIIGVGTGGEIVEGGFFLAEGVHNVIIRNLTVRDTFVEGDWEGKTQDFDGVQMDTAHHVWIDHCHFHHLGDGIIDSRKDTTFLTVSWSVLSDHNKAFGIGWTDNVTAEMTIHHNWFRDLNQRNPSIDNVLRAHLYNNFLQRIDSYGNYARGGTNLVLENSVFDTVNDPHYGDTGSLVATGNIYRNTSGQQETFGSAFFDPSDFYSYDLDPASEVEAQLAECAGPLVELGQ